MKTELIKEALEYLLKAKERELRYRTGNLPPAVARGLEKELEVVQRLVKQLTII